MLWNFPACLYLCQVFLIESIQIYYEHMKKFQFLALMMAFSGTALMVTSCDKSDNCGDTPPTYTSEIKAIIDAKCANCHKTGGVAESSGVYTTYNDLKPNLAQSWTEIDAGRMPQAGFPQLTDAEKAAYECWKNAGFPEN